MGCHDWADPTDAEIEEERRRREEAIGKIVTELRKWIDGGGGQFVVESKYDSQYASEPTYSVYVKSPTVSVRIGRR